MRIIDTHAHYDDEVFSDDRDFLLAQGLKDAGVELAVTLGASMEGAEASTRLAQQYPMVYAGCGLHPDEVGTLEEAAQGEASDISVLLRTPGILHLRSLLGGKKVVCVGEIGLDYHWMVQPKEIQQKWFAAQLHLATELGLPINVHSRDAAQDTFDIIVKHHTVAEPAEAAETTAAGENTADFHGRRTTTGGIIHCYSGSPDMAKDYVSLGYHIGVGGVVTFKNSKKLRKVVECIPIEALVTETDSPYLAPEPVRGTRNDSRNIRYVIEKIAEIKGMDIEECAEILRENALRVYRIN